MANVLYMANDRDIGHDDVGHINIERGGGGGGCGGKGVSGGGCGGRG